MTNLKLNLIKETVPSTSTRDHGLAQLAADEDDEVLIDDDDRMVRKSDNARLRKIARDVTNRAVMEHMREKGG